MATLQLCILVPPPKIWLVKNAIYRFCLDIAEGIDDNSIDDFCHSVVLADNIDVDTSMYLKKRMDIQDSFKLELKGVTDLVQYLQKFAETNLNIKFKDIKKIFKTTDYTKKYPYRDALNQPLVSLADLLTTDGGVKSDSIMPKLSQLRSFIDMQKSTRIDLKLVEKRLKAAEALYDRKFPTALEGKEDNRKNLFVFAFCMASTNPETEAKDAHEAFSAVFDDATEFDSEKVFKAGFEAGRLSKL